MNKLENHPYPIDGVAAKVMFSKGEHFEPKIIDGYKVWTMDNPPRKRELPERAKDYTGLRYGHMTALWFYKQQDKPRGKSIWVCRCDCGKYEFRKPCKWLRAKNQLPSKEPDKCEICKIRDRNRQGINTLASTRTAVTRPDRLMKWVNKMRGLGLSDMEIADIRRLDIISTEGKTVKEIREELNILRASYSSD